MLRVSSLYMATFWLYVLSFYNLDNVVNCVIYLEMQIYHKNSLKNILKKNLSGANYAADSRQMAFVS